MKKKTTAIHLATIVDDNVTFTLDEMCQHCSIHAEVILDMVDYGVLEPMGKKASEWRFDLVNLRRSQTVLNLQSDLGINLAGAALVVDLLEELNDLRNRIDHLEHHLRKFDQ